MNKDELKGKAENLKGRVKEAMGSISGNKEKEGEGLVDRVKGAVREKLGKAKEEVSPESPSEDEDVSSREDRSVSREEDDDE
jgi:uncharacterized protein YjbJ (UPF0337 family)